MTALLEVRGITVRFGDFQAVSGVDLDIAPGTIHSVIGPNGAGKTTLFNALTGIVRPTAGRVVFEGRDISRMATYDRVHLGMARSFQVTNIFQELSVAENLRLGIQATAGARSWVFWRSPLRDGEVMARLEALLERIGLADRREMRAGDLSHGAQRALEIGMALASGPKLLFLDEPLAGMGIDDIEITARLIRELTADHTILLVEHNMSVVLDISDRIAVLAQGRKIAEGDPAHIRQHPQVREAYLGSAA